MASPGAAYSAVSYSSSGSSRALRLTAHASVAVPLPECQGTRCMAAIPATDGLPFAVVFRLDGRRNRHAGHRNGQVGISSLPKVAFVTWAKATYQAVTPQVMPT
jgi:hypothetical protein